MSLRGHNIITTYITIIMEGHNNNNNGFLWGAIITIWGIHGHKNSCKGDTLIIKITACTSIIGT